MTRLFITPVNIVLAVILLGFVVAGFVSIPAGTMLPVHWGFDGQPDTWQPREVALLIGPALAIVLAVILGTIRRYGSRGRAESAVHVLKAAFTALLVLALGIEAAIVLIGMGYPVDIMRIVGVCMAVLLVLLGNAMPKSQPNSFGGIRIPSTLRDPANWQATHRISGALMMLAGVIVAVAALLVSSPVALLIIIVAGLLVPLIVGSVYSLTRRA